MPMGMRQKSTVVRGQALIFACPMYYNLVPATAYRSVLLDDMVEQDQGILPPDTPAQAAERMIKLAPWVEPFLTLSLVLSPLPPRRPSPLRSDAI